MQGHVEAKCLRRLEVDTQIELGRLHHWEIAGLPAFYNASSVNSRLTKGVRQASAVTHQPPGEHVIAYVVHHRNGVAGSQRNNAFALDEKECIARNDTNLRVVFAETTKSCCEIALTARLGDANLKTKNPRCYLYLP